MVRLLNKTVNTYVLVGKTKADFVDMEDIEYRLEKFGHTRHFGAAKQTNSVIEKVYVFPDAESRDKFKADYIRIRKQINKEKKRGGNT